MDETPQFDFHFTPSQAEQILPATRDVLRFIQVLLLGAATLPYHPTEAASSQQAEEEAELLAELRASVTPPELVSDFPPIPPTQEERLALANKLLRALGQRGIVVQDWRRGLIDFPTWHEGREVFLCYELRDGRHITHYHEIDAGFAGRRPLPPELQA